MKFHSLSLQITLALTAAALGGITIFPDQEPVPAAAKPDPQPTPDQDNMKLDATRTLHLDSVRRLPLQAPMPEFLFDRRNGKGLSHQDLAGRNYIMVYLSAEQRNSERAAADAARILKKYHDAPLDLILVTADVDHLDYFEAFLSEARIELPLYQDSGHDLYAKLGLMAFPTTLVVNADGILEHVLLTRRSDYSHFLDTFAAHTLGQLSDEQMSQQLVAPTMSRSSTKSQAQRHREAARLLRESEWYDGAEQELQTALQLDPDSHPIRIDLADLYMHLKRYDAAEEVLDAILTDHKEHRGALLLLGILRFETGQIEEAMTLLENALIMNPDPERTHYYLGRIHESRGDVGGAVEHYRRALDRIMKP
jgi:tetratricopeptide (TPR) repeat protein